MGVATMVRATINTTTIATQCETLVITTPIADRLTTMVLMTHREAMARIAATTNLLTKTSRTR